MPPAYGVFEKFGTDSLTSNTVVVRLLGSDRQGIEMKTRKHWTEVVDLCGKPIKEISELVKKLIRKKLDICAYFNSHLVGSAPLSIAKSVGLLAEEWVYFRREGAGEPTG